MSNVQITKITSDQGESHIAGRFSHHKAGVTFEVGTRDFSLDEAKLWRKCLEGIQTVVEAKMKRELDRGKD
jgi:hypothetical protein